MAEEDCQNCINEENIDLEPINIRDANIIVVQEGKYCYCFTNEELVQIYLVSRGNGSQPRNPYTRNELPQDRVNEAIRQFVEQNPDSPLVEQINGIHRQQIGREYPPYDYYALPQMAIHDRVAVLTGVTMRSELIQQYLRDHPNTDINLLEGLVSHIVYAYEDENQNEFANRIDLVHINYMNDFSEDFIDEVDAEVRHDWIERNS